MSLKTLSLLALLLIPSFITAQHLKRKGSFGVAFYPTTPPDTTLQRLRMKTTKGILIKFIVPHSTAAQLKLKADDLIVKINGQATETPAIFLNIAQKLRAEEKISVEALRKGKIIYLKGTVIAKPIEKSETADIIYDEFAFDGGYIRTILKKQKNKKPIATIFYLQGIGCYSLDNFQATEPTKSLIDGFVEKGFAVYRVEKAGMGDSDSPNSCQTMGFNQELALFREGYKKLLANKDLDSSNIFLLGHSMGGIVAPMLAQEFQPKGVIVYGTGLRPWQNYLLDAIKVQDQWYGGDLADLQDTIELIKPTFFELFYNHKPVEELIKDSTHLWALQRGLYYDTNTKLAAAGRTIPYQIELNSTNVAAAWKHTKSYVLTMYGEADIAAMYPDDHIAIADYVNKVHPGKATYLFVPKTNHTMQEIGTKEEYFKMQENPQAYEKFAAEHFNYKVVDLISSWAMDKINK